MSPKRKTGRAVLGNAIACFWCDQALVRFKATLSHPELKSRIVTKDHLIPKSKGGRNFYVPACDGCNRLRGNMDPFEFRDKFRQNVPKEKLEAAIREALAYQLACKSGAGRWFT
jgi:hypothetical protein